MEDVSMAAFSACLNAKNKDLFFHRKRNRFFYFLKKMKVEMEHMPSKYKHWGKIESNLRKVLEDRLHDVPQTRL